MITRNYEEMIGKYNYKYLGAGSEARVYTFQNKVIKEFYNDLPQDLLQRKKEILLLLSEIEELKKYYPEIKYLCENKNSILAAYVMKRIYGINLNSKHANFSIQDILKIIARLKIILEEFRKYGLLYLDIRKPNIMINIFKRPTLLDIDSITLLENPIIGILPDALEPYMKRSGKLDEHSQTYMLNILTMNLLYKVLSTLEIDKEGQEMIKLYEENEHLTPDSIFDHEYLYEHVKAR